MKSVADSNAPPRCATCRRNIHKSARKPDKFYCTKCASYVNKDGLTDRAVADVAAAKNYVCCVEIPRYRLGQIVTFHGATHMCVQITGECDLGGGDRRVAHFVPCDADLAKPGETIVAI
jgi:hypothetical protein